MTFSVNQVTNASDHVTVVALLAANSLYSRRHAVQLDMLRAELRGRGLSVDVLGVNAHSRTAQLMLSELQDLVNYTVFENPHHSQYWSVLGGLRDDVLVYDKCGRLAYYVPFPRSDVRMMFVQLAIRAAYLDSP